MNAAMWALVVGSLLGAAAAGLVVTGAICNHKAKQQPRPELEGSPAEQISTAYERTEITP